MSAMKPIPAVALACALVSGALAPSKSKSIEWPYYGGDQGGMKYSPIDQIDRRNVSTLLSWAPVIPSCGFHIIHVAWAASFAFAPG